MAKEFTFIDTVIPLKIYISLIYISFNSKVVHWFHYGISEWIVVVVVASYLIIGYKRRFVGGALLSNLCDLVTTV